MSENSIINVLSKNCIFSCIFHQSKFLDLYFLLLESYFLSNPTNTMIDFVIYTSTPFMEIIKQSRFFNPATFLFIINDTLQTVDAACKARLDVFDFPIIESYEKILYLDTDVLIKGNINIIFNICTDETIYATQEGSIDHEYDFWGSNLFEMRCDLNKYNNKTAFSSGVMVFKNCVKIRDLFQNIKQDILETNIQYCCCDQPYIVYNAFKYNLYNNTLLNSYAANNDDNIYSGKIIHHFPGLVGLAEHKLIKMNNFLNNIKDAIQTEFIS